MLSSSDSKVFAVLQAAQAGDRRAADERTLDRQRR
jgi:hypothetical protein